MTSPTGRRRGQRSADALGQESHRAVLGYLFLLLTRCLFHPSPMVVPSFLDVPPHCRFRSTNPLPYHAMPLVHTRSNFVPKSAFHQVGNYRSYRPERIEAVDLLGDPPLSITLGSTCGLCQELLTDSSPLCQELLTSTDVSVVAVLVCGHFYHADCLEGKTSEAHKRDPPCPVCFFESIDAV
ncbi:hypothetical protein EJ110_NYTH19749 [Nymphaea thermarum]|nr:hypothetical protein EJ110_NYTH19749 [Nymphaea thermarum]